jgi:hypothetical protein
MKSEHINLWSAMTSLEGKDLSQSDAAEKVVKMADATCGFASELSLKVDEHGTWCVRLFRHDESSDSVELSVSKNGIVTVTKCESYPSGLTDRRSVSLS